MGSMIKGIASGVVAMLLVGIAVWLTVAYSGAYNVAATDMHADAIRWTFETTMHRSVANRASGVELPERFSEDLIAAGAGHYAETCAHCHGAPGQEPADWSRGMRPEPPHLVEAAAEWTAAEIHWIVENGIKMTGMPAFGPHHQAEEIVAITAFVSQLPGLSPEDYAALTGGVDGRGDAAAPTPASEPAGETATEPN
jgi:mono/diheme cytochrome c family protein